MVAHSEPPRRWRGRNSIDKGSFVNLCPRSGDYFCWYLLYNVWCNTLLGQGMQNGERIGLINTSRRAEVTGAKVNIDLEQLELLRASQVSVPLCLAAAPVPVTAGIMLGGQGQPLQQHARAVKAAQRIFVWLLLLFPCCNCALLPIVCPKHLPCGDRCRRVFSLKAELLRLAEEGRKGLGKQKCVQP